jgi:Fic family protein
MQKLSYNLSPGVQQSLRSIETARQGIVLRPLSPKVSHRLMWEAKLDRVYYSLRLSFNPISKKDIATILSSPGKARTRKSELDVIRYRRSFDYIRQEWSVNPKPIMPQTIGTLYRMVTGEKLPITEQQLMEMLVFLQTSSESPLVQAYVAYLQFTQLVPQDEGSGKVARLLPYLFIYRPGYDFRGLLVLEEYFYKNERLLREVKQVIAGNESITPWIEHFITGVGELVGVIEEKLRDEQSGIMPASFWELTERQKEILSSFDAPGTRITNKKVQAMFTISQITASRDLARLANLGFLFTYGKGRSVYYLKV